ncbi:hypothetical protein [Pelagibacterium limicola]|uniref:hypothetical protein n=1 Tax=Pelagibacterium limicola TaxID=2791022 RepID=UPI0018AF8887|nr:hypothetical protein [Pelagibacterium limicola]
MLSKPIASGVMLTALLLVGGGALLQSDSPDNEAHTATVTVEPEVVAAPERPASVPNRVADRAGFPVVPDADEVAAATSGPIVTVNGRPLDGERSTGSSTPAQTATVQPREETPAAQRPAEQTQPERVPQANEPSTQTAGVIEPPRPIPRPEGLSVPRQQQAVDYEAIAAIAYGQDRAVPDTGEFMSLEERSRLGAVAGEDPYAPYDPRREGLVAIVGPDGEPIWIYEEQVRGNATTNSGVTFQQRRVQSHPYGFVYDDFRW